MAVVKILSCSAWLFFALQSANSILLRIRGDGNSTQAVAWSCHADWESGTFKQLRYAAESLHHALLHNMSWVPSGFGSALMKKECDVPFDKVIDLSTLENTFPGTVLRNSSLLGSVEVDCVGQLACGPAVAKTDAWKRILVALRPATPLREAAASILDGLGPSFVCLHARIEKDFEDVFKRSSRFKDLDALSNMMAEHDFGDIDTLYVASADANVSFDNISFKRIVVKDYVAASMLDGAWVDMEVCKQASIHVGNAGSIWDEWLSEWRKVMGKPSLMYAGDRKVEHLEPFVGCNDKRHLGNP